VSGLVSCIIATGNRRTFLQQALRNFALRNYPHSELIVVDDGDVPAEDICSGMAGVIYIRLPARTPTGTKLNIGIEAAHGDILQKIDDDDYYGPDFLTLASGRLNASDNPRAVVAWCCFAVLIAGDGDPFFSGHGWKAGGTLCFRRELWKQRPFRDTSGSEDSFFLRDHQAEILRVCAPDQYILVRHGGNTWHRIQRKTGKLCAVEEYFRERKRCPQTIGQISDEPSRDFYRALMQKGAEQSAAPSAPELR
jgi:glycosyltransferase involved in cell wall biosynthesis